MSGLEVSLTAPSSGVGELDLGPDNWGLDGWLLEFPFTLGDGSTDRGVVGDGLCLEDEEEFGFFEELPDEDREPGLVGPVLYRFPGGHHSGRFPEEAVTAILDERQASCRPSFT